MYGLDNGENAIENAPLQEETDPVIEGQGSVEEDFDALMKRFEGHYESPVSVRRSIDAQTEKRERDRVSKTVHAPNKKNSSKKTSAALKNKTSFFEVASVILFFLICTGMLFVGIYEPDKDYSEKENRKLASFPTLSAASLAGGDFMDRFETYLSDQTPGRDTVVSVRSALLRLLGKNETNGVLLGKDGWLFEKPSVYSEEKVKTTVSALSAFSSSCGIEHQAFILVPDSSCILPEKLPSFFVPEDQKEQIEKIYSQLPDTVKSFNAVSCLQNAESREELYYKNDHHWTTKGAKTVADAFLPGWFEEYSGDMYSFHKLSDDFYGTLASSSGIRGEADPVYACIPTERSEYIFENSSEQIKRTSVFDLSALERTNKYEVFFGGNFPILSISTLNPDGKKLLILKDSYANCFIPMLTPFFSEIVIIDARYYTEQLSVLLETESFTHLLVLYNVNTFLEDTSLKDVL